jgi:DNA-binding SARP family transcriptional activator
MAYSAAPLAERLGRSIEGRGASETCASWGLQAQLDAGPALLLPTRKTEALLAYLALPLGQAHPREKLASRLWGDMPDAQARGNLRNALSRIRKALPRTARPGLVLDGRSVALNPSGAPRGR